MSSFPGEVTEHGFGEHEQYFTNQCDKMQHNRPRPECIMWMVILACVTLNHLCGI